jgi:glutathione S-transferase
MIDLYTAPTPNGWKASVTLEELGLPYEVHALNLTKNEQKESWFLAINPNGRIPAIVDRECGNLAVFESGAIMIHLAEKAGRLLPTDVAARARVLSWLMFQIGGVGPMMGQANVFFRYFPDKIQPAIDRYQNESRRLFEVLDRRLGDSEWLDAIKARPACQRGVEVPFRIESLVRDEKAAQDFAEKARGQLQR